MHESWTRYCAQQMGRRPTSAAPTPLQARKPAPETGKELCGGRSAYTCGYLPAVSWLTRIIVVHEVRPSTLGCETYVTLIVRCSQCSNNPSRIETASGPCNS